MILKPQKQGLPHDSDIKWGGGGEGNANKDESEGNNTNFLYH